MENRNRRWKNRAEGGETREEVDKTDQEVNETELKRAMRIRAENKNLTEAKLVLGREQKREKMGKPNGR